MNQSCHRTAPRRHQFAIHCKIAACLLADRLAVGKQLLLFARSDSGMAASTMMKWSSFSLHPRAPDVAETTGYKEDDGVSGSAGPVDGGLHPAAVDLQHELADHILNVGSNLDEAEQLVDVPPSEVGAEEGRWDTNSLPAHWFSWRKLWRFTGPGFLMSIAYIVSSRLVPDSAICLGSLLEHQDLVPKDHPR